MSTKRDPRIFVGSARGTPLYTTRDPEAARLVHDASAFATSEERHVEGGAAAPHTPAQPLPAFVVTPHPHRAAQSGLPLRTSGEPRVAEPVLGRAWAGPKTYVEPLAAGLDPTTRRALGEAWLRDALEEHASIGAFAELAMSLLALGAPADLLERTQRAATDEVDHARRCFALASAYLGASVGPGPLAVGALPTPDLLTLALDTWRDGCLGEGAGAAIARAARRRAHDPAVCAALTVISRDEGAHAELAWEVLAFCLAHGGRPVADALGAAVASTPTHTPDAPEPPPSDESPTLTALLAEHGRLPAADRARCAVESARTAVRRAGWLLAPGSSARARTS
jgi:hypothetical protein